MPLPVVGSKFQSWLYRLLQPELGIGLRLGGHPTRLPGRPRLVPGGEYVITDELGVPGLVLG